MRVLVVEDDADVAALILKGLRDAGHEAEHAGTGPAAFEMVTTRGGFDVITLDRMLPGVPDGLDVLERLRSAGDTTPVLVLSALGEVDERVRGLKAGSDDYLGKPFAFPELLARVEALTRRARDAPVTRLVVGDLELDLLARQVRRAGHKLDLQPREFRLLEYLMRHAGQVVTRTMLLEGVWDYHFDPQTNVIDVHVSRLRQKVDRPFATAMIHTVRNSGYMLKAE